MFAVFPIDLPVMAPHWKLSSGDYHRMIAAGILWEDARIELIEGELIDRAPIGYPHISTVNLINESLTQLVRGRAIVNTRNPIWLGPKANLSSISPCCDRARFATGPACLAPRMCFWSLNKFAASFCGGTQDCEIPQRTIAPLRN